MSVAGWRSERWWRAVGYGIAVVASLVAAFEVVSWLHDEHLVLSRIIQWSLYGIVAVQAIRRRNALERRFPGGRDQEKAYHRALRQGFIPREADLGRLRAHLTREVTRPHNGYVTGFAIGLFITVLLHAWPDQPTLETLLPPVGGATAVALATGLLVIPLARRRRHAARLLNAVAEREAEESRGRP